MDIQTIKAVKNSLKNNFPKLWKLYHLLRSVGKKEQISLIKRSLIERWEFGRCIKSGKPYFGSIMAARQGHSMRHAYMQALVELECSRRDKIYYRILEIGSWAGGSAISWAAAIKEFNDGNGFVICVDPWIRYTQGGTGGVYEAMDKALKTGRIFELFLHNIRTAGHEDIVRVTRATSGEILPLLKPHQFDLIFIDGSHAYSDVAQDIENAMPLVRDGGILCGDDLELQTIIVDLENARANCQKDFVLDPKTKQWFHPGVTLAVAEFFGEVSVWEGFWAMRKQGSAWEKVVLEGLDGENISIPKHLTSM